MVRALKTCSTPGCPNLVATGRCPTCTRAADQARGTATDRGYGHEHRTRFRAGVLRRDPICTCTDETHGHGARCWNISTVADHHPHSRRELIALGLDPNDPAHGRGLCEDCHNKHTSTAQPGGWNAR